MQDIEWPSFRTDTPYGPLEIVSCGPWECENDHKASDALEAAIDEYEA